VTDAERQLPERLAAEGKATKLYVEDLPVAKSLVSAGLVFPVGENEPYAVKPQREDACWQSLSGTRRSHRSRPLAF
jgi:hypothetical protein